MVLDIIKYWPESCYVCVILQIFSWEQGEGMVCSERYGLSQRMTAGALNKTEQRTKLRENRGVSFFLSLLPSYSLKLELQSLAWPHSALSGINKMNLILRCGPKSISQKSTKSTEAMTPTQFYRDTRSSPQWLWVTHGHTKIWTVLMWRLKMWF